LTVYFAFSIGSAKLVSCDVIMSILSIGIISAVSLCPRPDSEKQWILTFYGIIYAHERKKIIPFLLFFWHFGIEMRPYMHYSKENHESVHKSN
jgi:hypothetical protein